MLFYINICTGMLRAHAAIAPCSASVAAQHNPCRLLRAANAKAAACRCSPQIKIHPTIWQLGKNNLDRLGACCRLFLS